MAHDWTNGAALLVKLRDQPLVAVIQPPPPATAPWRVPVLVIALVVGLFSAVFVTLLPPQRQMTELSRAANRLGGGALEARAQVQTADAAGQVAETFNEMAARVEGLLRAREELLLAVAHELRTQLARLRFAIELLADSDDATDREEQRVEIEGDITEPEELVSELFTFASLQSGRELAPEPADLVPLAAEAVANADRLRADRAVTLRDGPASAPVAVEVPLWRRAAKNLLSNAVRYTATSVEASLAVEGGQALLVVDDDGPGVPEADRERIFEPLVRLDAARTRNAGGVGMGLAMARRIARSHGGDLWVEASPLGGGRASCWPSRCGHSE